MLNIADTDAPIRIAPPSWWFWLKAGFGFGVGFMAATAIFGFIAWFVSLAFLGAFFHAAGLVR